MLQLHMSSFRITTGVKNTNIAVNLELFYERYRTIGNPEMVVKLASPRSTSNSLENGYMCVQITLFLLQIRVYLSPTTHLSALSHASQQ